MSIAISFDGKRYRIELVGFYVVPPPPKTRSGMTARGYRAARREYDRRRRATREINRAIGLPEPTSWLAR
jgi:hypothetical protein